MQVTLATLKEAKNRLPLPLYSSLVPAGFPSPADDYIEDSLDLNEFLVKHPSATFFARAAGLSMVSKGILDGALLVVDRALHAKHGDVVIAIVNGELTCKIFDEKRKMLLPANNDFPPIPLNEDMDCQIQGVVTFSVNRTCTHS